MMRRISVLPAVILLTSVLWPSAAWAQAQSATVIGKINEARRIAEQALIEQRKIQDATDQLVESSLNPQRIDEIERQYRSVDEKVTALSAVLSELKTSPNCDAATGAAMAAVTIQQTQITARKNYALQMLKAELKNDSAGDKSAGMARIKDALQQAVMIRKALEGVVVTLTDAAEAAKKPCPIRRPDQKPGLEGRLTLPASPRPKGSIEGVVLAADTGKGIPGATVILSRVGRQAVIVALLEDQPKPGPVDPVTTDENGHFAFGGLDSDQYSIDVRKAGYLLDISTRGGNGATLPINLDVGQDLRNLELRMALRGSVKGHVQDARGQAAAGVPVQLLQSSRIGLPPALRLIAETTTDERGNYRLDDLASGSYLLAAGAGITDRIPAGAPRDYGYAFFPSALSANSATPVIVGNSTAVADIALLRTGRYRIRGRVVDEMGGVLPSIVTSFSTSTTPTGLLRMDTVDNDRFRYNPTDGTFDLTDLPPGSYTITMLADLDADHRLGGQATVVVADSDIEGMRIVLFPIKITRP